MVATWDDDRGYGTIRSDETGAEHFFHCTQILDGTRTIEAGAAVEFDVVPGRLGRWEATRIEKR
jgi:cold shock CspA family protein